ncbi:MAG: Stp1/IreP family PP2C-type Ser/Thr phosphatase [Bacillota bacterium]
MWFKAISDVGLVRKGNEDSYLVCPEKGLFIVADGMGGHRAGEVASQKAVEVVRDHLGRSVAPSDDPLESLLQAVSEANRVIYHQSISNPDLEGMGTTLTVGLIKSGVLYIAHVGDSRAYLLRDREGRLITNDHSLVGELMRSGSLTENEALVHPQRHMLTRALGTAPEVEIDLAQITLYRGDYLLFCTDGLTQYVTLDEIVENVYKNVDLDEAAASMFRSALARGGQDNITLVLARCEQ